MLREMGTASIGSAADVIDSSRLQPILMTVARDRAADRGCTGSCDGAEDVGPPGERVFAGDIWSWFHRGLAPCFVPPGFGWDKVLFALRPQLQRQALLVEPLLIGRARV